MACYVFFRCWPGFSEKFPVERFNALSEAELPEALDSFAREQRRHEALLRQSRRVLRGGESSFARQQLRAEKAETKTVPADPKERLCEALLRQLTVLPGSGGPAPGERLTRREAEPRVWFLRTNDRAFAEYLVGRLNGRTLAEDFEVVEVEKVLNPRFGYVAAEGLGRQERAAIQRQVNAIRDGEEPPVWHRKMALLLGQRARGFAEREAGAWVDSADPEWRRKALATIDEWAEQVLPTKAVPVDEGGGEGGGGKPRGRKTRRKRTDPKAAERRKERAAAQKRDAEIFKEWRGQVWQDYQDYANWKNEHLPEGWPRLDRRLVKLAVEREKARLKRAGKWPPDVSRR